MKCNDVAMSIASKFKYLGIVFSNTTSGSFSKARATLGEQDRKAMYQMNKYVAKLLEVDLNHHIDLFEKRRVFP